MIKGWDEKASPVALYPFKEPNLKVCRTVLLTTLLVAPLAPCFAQETQVRSATPKPAASQEDPWSNEKQPIVTHHQLKLPGSVLRYAATAGRLVLRQENGTADAAIFFTAYTLEGGASRTRPLTFVFNGGPGTATAWLHLGALGPRKIQLEEDGGVPAPPYVLEDNPFTTLDVTDLVFIDAPGTGYSRIRPESAKKFYNINGDADAFYRFIRDYLTKYQRWGSPIFLFGESYGTTRAAALSNYLADHYIPVSGVAMLSVALDFQTLYPGNMNDLPYQLLVPTYAMIAGYHKLLAPDLTANMDDTIKKIEEWCASDYAGALAKGSALEPEARQRVVATLSRYTGVKPEVIEKNDLRIGPDLFRNSLLEDRKLVVGRVDGRFTAQNPESNAREPFFDPAMALMFPAFNSAMNEYAETELQYQSEVSYTIWNPEEVNRAWDWSTGLNGYPQTLSSLQSGMAKNKHLKVLAMGGLYDISTPFYATSYTFQHLRINAEDRSRITFANFKGGHMVYADKSALKEMNKVVENWYAAVLK